MCWHKWPRWSELNTDNKKIPYQTRECAKCGLVQIAVPKVLLNA